MALTGEQAAATVDTLYARLAGRRRDIDRHESYFRGEQPLAYASPEWQAAHAGRYKNFSDNWCGIVGGAAAERTEVFGIRLGNDTESRDAEETLLWRDWDLNEMPLQSAQGFLTSSVSARSAVLVWGSPSGEPEVTWEHPSQVIVDYDPAGRRRRFALKAWLADDLEFASLYTPDEVWKFQRPRVAGSVVNGQTASGLYVSGGPFGVSGGWVPREVPAETWPLENPFGVVPIVEYPRKPTLGGEPLSRIAGTIAMQDAVNLLWAYLFVAADFASMPARVVMGQEPPKMPILDANGQKVGEKPVDIAALSKGRMLWLTGEKTSINSWDAAKLDVFTSVINIAVKHMASQTKTPIHYIVGDLGNVNGETLVATETPLAMDVREDHKAWTPPTREVFRLMAVVRGNSAVADACRTATVMWRDPETRSYAQLSDAALKDRQVGFPLAWVAEHRYGLSQPDIARLMEMVTDQQSDPTLERIARDLIGTGDAPTGV